MIPGSGIQDIHFGTGPQEHAYMARRWNVPAELPAGPATAGGYPVISAEEALTALRRGKPHNTAPGPRVPITGMRLGTSTFATDRGFRKLPAWLVDFRGSDRGPVAVPAVAAPARYLYRAKSRDRIVAAQVDAGGRNLTIQFHGVRWLDGHCDREFEIARAESAQVVAVEIVPLRRAEGADSDPTSRCESIDVPGIGGMHTLTFPLVFPLGGRAVVSDVRNSPIALTDKPITYRPGR